MDQRSAICAAQVTARRRCEGAARRERATGVRTRVERTAVRSNELLGNVEAPESASLVPRVLDAVAISAAGFAALRSAATTWVSCVLASIDDLRQILDDHRLRQVIVEASVRGPLTIGRLAETGKCNQCD